MQFKGGYIIDSIATIITEKKFKFDNNKKADCDKLNQLNGLLQHVTSFDVDFSNYKYDPDFRTINSVLATVNNIITRGLPTRAPEILEDLFVKIGLVKPKVDESELNFPALFNDITFDKIFELLHIIEPELEINKSNYGGKLGSNLEWKFIKENPIFLQILESQRDFKTINETLGGGKTVDFSFTSPYLYWDEEKKCFKNIGRIFEVDGPHHLLTEYKYYDTSRDNLASSEGFETFRYNTISINNASIDYTNLIEKDIYAILNINFKRNIKENLIDYSLIFIPLAVARIQKTLLELFINDADLLNKQVLEIAIIERDFPCGAIAIKSLQEMFTNINAILEEKDQLKLPEIKLTIYENPTYKINIEQSLNATIKKENEFENTEFDIILDHSILRRIGIYNEPDFISDKAIKIRSSHYNDTTFGKSRRVYCANLLNYKCLVDKMPDGSYQPIEQLKEPINYFIRNIFRKKGFREGQLPIISRALQQKPVIGLLPTGGGKSLTFQLPAFLQPGLCLVVDPIKSLMEDQVRVLKLNWIDCCDYLNSNLEREEKAKKIIDFLYGETLFFFFSPERFVMKDFREIVQNIHVSKFGLAFSYCVIDEVHCVSEWGHDFRTTYLMLGKNAQKFARNKAKKPVSLIGLTATASFDVLADIERELQIEHDDVANAIIMIENTIRPELFFRVIDISNKDRITALNDDFKNIGKNLSKYNNDDSILEQSLAHHYIEFENLDYGKKYDSEPYILNEKGTIEIKPKIEALKLKNNIETLTQNDFYAIVFCPTRGLFRNNAGLVKDVRSVNYVYENLVSESKGFFYSSDNIDSDGLNEELNNEVQEHFRKFTNDKLKHIVCTKAFGMGIDKKDIRSTYHYIYSGSLESLVQEAGRSGRDKNISEANILVSTKKIVKLDVYQFFKDNKSDKHIKNKYTRKAIREVFEKKWVENTLIRIKFETLEQMFTELNKIDFSITPTNGARFNIQKDSDIVEIREKLLQKDNQGKLKYVLEKFEDRGVHDFFHSISFKGVDTEKSQIWNLFIVKEFQIAHNNVVYIDRQDTLVNEFNKSDKGTFKFIMTKTKIYEDASSLICELLRVNPNAMNRTNLFKDDP